MTEPAQANQTSLFLNYDESVDLGVGLLCFLFMSLYIFLVIHGNLPARADS